MKPKLKFEIWKVEMAAFSFLLSAFAAAAQPAPIDAAHTAMMVKPSSGAAPSVDWTETWEGAGVRTWISVNDIADIKTNSTSPVLYGTEALRMSDISPFSYIYASITARDTNSVSGVLYLSLYHSTTTIFTASRIGVADDCKVTASAIGQAQISHGSVGSSVGAVMPLVTIIFWWVDWSKGTGADGIARFYWSTTNSRPSSSDCSVTTGNSTSQPTAISIQGDAGADFSEDQISPKGTWSVTGEAVIVP